MNLAPRLASYVLALSLAALRESNAELCFGRAAYSRLSRPLADGFPDGRGELQKDGEVLCEFDIPVTGGWNEWTSITCNVNLEAGEQILRVYVKQAPWNLDWMEFSRSEMHQSNMQMVKEIM